MRPIPCGELRPGAETTDIPLSRAVNWQVMMQASLDNLAPSSAEPVVHIYVCHHKSAITFADASFRPIHVGRAISGESLEMPGDDTGDNISPKNPSFCELTAIYWAWKNDLTAEWVGLMHYRRFMAVVPSGLPQNAAGLVTLENLAPASIEGFGLTHKAVQELLLRNPSVNAFLPQKWSVRDVGSKNLRSHYKWADFHNEKDLNITREVIDELFPEHTRIFDQIMNEHSGYFTNIFLLRRDIFNQYCEWLFKILFEVEKRIDISSYSVQSARVFGYLSERLFNVFLRTLPKGVLVPLELERIFIANPDLPPKDYTPPSAPPEGAISITIASDDGYAPHLSAILASIKEKVSPDRFLDCIVLDGGISKQNKTLLEKAFSENLPSGGRLHFADCSQAFREVKTHSSFTTATFYRLALDETLKNHIKVLYLDCDMIVRHDIAELWDTDLGTNIIAASPDLIMKSFVNARIKSLPLCGGQPAKEYLKDYLGLGDRYDEYFQAGVILFDLDAIRKTKILREAIDDLKTRTYWFLDQDVLNRHFLGKVHFLDTKWNFANVAGATMQSLNAQWAKQLQKDSENPAIVHFAGHEAKPWNNPLTSWAEIYWHYQRKTPWYEKVLYQALASSNKSDAPLPSRLYGILRFGWRKLPRALRWRLQGTAMRIVTLLR